jgi:hypothetical protein
MKIAQPFAAGERPSQGFSENLQCGITLLYFPKKPCPLARLHGKKTFSFLFFLFLFSFKIL